VKTLGSPVRMPLGELLVKKTRKKMENTEKPARKPLHTGRQSMMSRKKLFYTSLAEADVVLPSSVVAFYLCRLARGIPPAAVGR